MSKVQEDDKKRKRQGQDEIELVETSEACVTRPRAPKRRKNTEFLSRGQVNCTSVTAKSPLGTTSKTRFLWTTKTKEAFFEALCKHGKDFEKICVFMNSKPHLKQIIPTLSKDQVRFFFYRTWKLVSGYYAAIKQGNGDSSKPCDMAASTEVPTAAPMGGAMPSASTKEYLTDEELFCDEPQPPVNLVPIAAESIVGGAKDDLENNTAEEEMFSDEGRVTPVTADIEKDEISDNSEHESEDDIEEEPSPLEAAAEEPEDQGTTEEQEDPLPLVGGAGHSATQEQSSGGTNVPTMTGKVLLDGRMLPLDLVSLICYGKYRSKLQALGNKSEIGTKLYQLVHDGITTIRYKGRRMQLKMPLCVALKNDNRSTEQCHDGIMAGGIPDRTDHMILKLTAYNSESWSHVQRLSFNPRLRVVLPSNKTLSSMIKLLTERWNFPESEERNSVKIFYWLQAPLCDDKERGCCSHQISCEQEDHAALELTYDGDTTLADIAMKLQVKNNLELMYDISGLVHKEYTPADRMGSLLRVVKVASKNERITPRVLSRISPRKYTLFGSSFQRLTHRMAFGSRSRVKLDFSSPKKSETAAASAATSTAMTSPPTTAVATPTNVEEMHTVNQSPRVNVIVQQTPTSEDTGNNQSLSSTSGNNQSQKSGVKSSNKKLKVNNRRTRIVTFDEHQLNQSGSFSSIPIKDLMILAQQQVNSFKSPKKSSTPCSLSPQPSSPLQSFPQPRQKIISTVTAVTIPNDIVSSVTPSSVVATTTAGVLSLQQQDVGGAGCSISGSSSSPHLGLSVTSATGNITTVAVVENHITTVPALMTTCAPVTVATPATTNTHLTSIQQDTEAALPPPVQTRPAKIIQQRPPRPATNQRNLIPQPLSFFNTSDKRVGIGGTAAGSQQSTQSGASVAEDTGKVLRAAESIKQQQGALGKTASSLNIQNLTVVQQIQLLALIQQYQTMQKPKPATTSQPSTTVQPSEDKILIPDHPHSTNETLNKSSPAPAHGRETDELDAELYKLMHAAPIKTTPKKLGQPSRSLPPDEVSSDTVNNLLSSLMNNQSSDKHQQDLARLASETAELLPSFTAGLLQGKSDTAGAGTSSAEPTSTLPELLLSNDTAQKPDHLPPLDSDSNPLGLFNLDNLLEDQDASLSAFLAYLESPKKKSASNNLPDLFSHEDLSNIASTTANNSNSSEEFSFQALLEENSQDLSNKFRELSNLLMQQSDTPMPFNT